MSITLLLKQAITFFIEPLGFSITLLALGFFFLLQKNYKKAHFFVTASLFAFLLFSYPPFANFLVSSLESSYPAYTTQHNIKYIHVLGHGHNTDPKQPISSHLSDGGTKRVLEGVLIYKNTPNAKLIFTGYAGKTDTPNAVMNARLAVALGVKKEDIIIGEKPDDTRQEALFSKNIVKNEPFVLVTSATHMPRAMQLFHSVGLHPIAAPTDFKREEFRGYLRAPSIHALQNSQTAIHEYIGMLWAKILSFKTN